MPDSSLHQTSYPSALPEFFRGNAMILSENFAEITDIPKTAADGDFLNGTELHLEHADCGTQPQFDQKLRGGNAVCTFENPGKMGTAAPGFLRHMRNIYIIRQMIQTILMNLAEKLAVHRFHSGCSNGKIII